MSAVAIFGAQGQLGKRLQAHYGHDAVPLTRAHADLENTDQIKAALNQAKPRAVINAAAYTNVEAAEDNEPLAERINAQAPASMAAYAKAKGIPFIHVSTDYVFDGTKSEPYTERDALNPLNAYGRTKLLGEQMVMAANPDAIILRVSWLYDASGKNFLTTIAGKARAVEELRIVSDQLGAPCFARDIARGIALVLAGMPKTGQRGVIHMTNSGETSWHGFAEALVTEMRTRETLPLKTIHPITSDAYPTKAQRPKNSRLDNHLLARAFEVTLPTWQDALTRCMKEWHEHN